MNPFTLPLQPLKQATDLPHLAINALILEPHLYPHLGLVAPHHNGAHHDMNYPLLVHSAHALTPYFHATLHLGLHPPPQRPSPELFHIWRALGRHAETSMFAATNGINTHKGCIFLLGLLLLAWAHLYHHTGQPPTSHALLNHAYHLAAPTINHEINHPPRGYSQTYGQWALHRHHWLGIRGVIHHNFPLLRHALRHHPPVPITTHPPTALTNHNQTITPPPLTPPPVAWPRLLFLAYSQDSNLLHRAGPHTTHHLRQHARYLYHHRHQPSTLGRLTTFNQLFTTHHWSAAAAGDLTAAYLLLTNMITHGYLTA